MVDDFSDSFAAHDRPGADGNDNADISLRSPRQALADIVDRRRLLLLAQGWTGI
jgi:hypothetical protein